jgi:hypothetical protein
MNELGNQFGSAIIVSYLLEYLKNSPFFPILSHLTSSRGKAVIGGIAAFITTVGIHYAFDYHPDSNSTITIIIPSMPELLHSLVDFAKQWGMQQFCYDTAVKDESVHFVPLTAITRPDRLVDTQGNHMESGH